MDPKTLANILSSLLAGSAPLVIASIGETLSERVGIVNLSLDGSIMLSAMIAFATAFATGSLFLGTSAAMAVGALIALVVAFASVELERYQSSGSFVIAVGFVLTYLCGNLADFLGKPYVRQPGPSVPYLSLPIVRSIPILGDILLRQTIITYISLFLILCAWLWMFKTQPGLRMRGVGERPEAAFARGINVRLLRYAYAVMGGALVGLSGAAYSLSVKLGWSYQHTAGMGWIALAIVIFGGWHPVRAAFGAYLFGILKTLGSVLQKDIPGLPSQIFQGAPFALMILVLIFMRGNTLGKPSA